MLRALLTDRRLWLLFLLVALVWVVGRHAVPVGSALWMVVQGGYWFMLAAFALWTWCVWRLARRDGWRTPRGKGEWGVVALIVAGGLVWQAHETHGYKILADEALLVGTAQTLHMDRDVGYPVRATDVQGPFQILQSVLDKRPYFYPFLVALAHDLTGYRAENAFWVNTVLGFVFLGVVYVLARSAAGTWRAGVLVVLLAIGLPLLAQQAAGAGFELLNVTLIAGWWALAIRLLAAPDDEAQDAFVMTAILLASTRYESLLFLGPTALVLVAAWWRQGGARCTWPTWVAPLFVLPMFWLNRAFAANEDNWQMKSMGADKPFGLEFLPGNLGHALKYFFTFDGYQPNSPYLALLGLLAIPVFVLWAQRIWRDPARADGAELGVALGAIGPLGVTGVLMVYFWGQFDHPVITRLSLPTQLLLLVGTVVVLGRVWRPRPAVWNALAGGALLALLAHGLPVMTKNAYGRDYGPGVAYAWRREFLARQESRDFLMLDRDPMMWIAEKVPATPIAQAVKRRDGIAYHLRNRSFSAVYVLQGYTIDPETGALKLEPEDDLGPDFVLEPVAQRRTQILHLVRFSRVVEIRDGEKVLAKAETAAWVANPKATPEEVAEARRNYLDRWVKELP